MKHTAIHRWSINSESLTGNSSKRHTANWRASLLLLLLLFPFANTQALVTPVATQLQVPGWMADIYVWVEADNRAYEFCKGALIASQWVLSAGSCLHDPNRYLDDVQGDPEYMVKLGPNGDLVEVEEFFPADDYSVGLFRIVLPSEAQPLPVSTKTAAQLLAAEVTILGRQSTEPVYDTYYNPGVAAVTASCKVNGVEYFIEGAFCYLLTKPTKAFTLFKTNATIIDPAATGAATTALDKTVKIDKTGKQLYIDFRTQRSYPCYEDVGAPVLVNTGPDSYEIAGVVTGVGMTVGLPVCGMSLANVFVSAEVVREFIDRTTATYEFSQRCPAAPKPTVSYVGGKAISLRWKPVRTATGYKVHYTSQHGQVPITTVTVSSQTQINTEIESGADYLVAVTAYNANCSSPLSVTLPINLDQRR
jgi:Trypsin/Fibronectin type III domain